MPFVCCNGGQQIAPDRVKYTGFMNSPQAVEALEFYASLSARHSVTPTLEEMDAFPSTRPPHKKNATLFAAGRAAMAEKHTAAAVVAAAALGLLERNNVPLPALGFVGTAGTYGIGAWLVGRYTGNQTMQHVATGLLSVAAYKLGKGETSGVSGDETIVGEF